MDKFSISILMAFLMIGGLVNSIVAIPQTLLIGAYGIIGNVAGLVFFVVKAVKAWKENK